MKRLEAFNAINRERDRQDQLHPRWNGDTHGLVVLAEEFGEVAKALYEYQSTLNHGARDVRMRLSQELEDELIQVAAVCVRWLENR